MDYISILINLIIAIVVAVVTSNLSLRGFYKQEIWLRKETKYSKIIDALNKIQRYYGYLMDRLSGMLELDECSYENGVKEKEYMIAKRELEILSSTPILMIHKDVSDILNELVISSNTKTKDERMGDYFSYYDRLHFEVQEAKIKTATIANKDLGFSYAKKYKSK